MQWLEATNGLGEGAFWLDFRDIRSAEYVLNRIGEPLFGANFGSAPVEAKLAVLAKALREHRFIIVWDSFESASGIAGNSVTANLPNEDRQLLARLLFELRGSATKVLITSRSEEEWLGSERGWRLPLTGLDGEERWEYCEAILRDLGLTGQLESVRKNSDYGKLMKQLGGHPLAMRVMLPQLEKRSPTQLSEALHGNLTELKLDSTDEAYAQLFSALRFIEHGLPESLQPLLFPLSLHEAYVDLDYLEGMAKQVPGGWSREQIDQLAATLATAGLLRDIGQAIYELHPALMGYLRSKLTLDQLSPAWRKAFVDVMGSVANVLALRPLHEQRIPFYLHGPNFYTALLEAERLTMRVGENALTQSLAIWARNNRDFTEAERLYLRFARDEEHAASGYHQLGMVAAKRRDFTAAEQWYRKSLVIKEKQGDEHGAAPTYHQLGLVAEERRDFAAAEQWYLKSVEISEKQGDEHGAASTYHQLGMVAAGRRDFAAAEQWYHKSLVISEKQGNEHYAASTYHQLGVISEERRDSVAAEQWYHKSLAIDEKQGDEHNAARIYHQLGRVATERRDFAAAEQWNRKSLAIKEKEGDEHGAAASYAQLARIAELQGQYFQAAKGFLRALVVFRVTDSHFAQLATGDFLRASLASAAEKLEIEALFNHLFPRSNHN